MNVNGKSALYLIIAMGSLSFVLPFVTIHCLFILLSRITNFLRVTMYVLLFPNVLECIYDGETRTGGIDGETKRKRIDVRVSVHYVSPVSSPLKQFLLFNYVKGSCTPFIELFGLIYASDLMRNFV